MKYGKHQLKELLEAEKVELFIQHLQRFLADVPYQLHLPKEAYYHSLIGMVLKLVGVRTIMERNTDKGRIDMVLELSDKIYIIEFKFATNKRIKRVKTLSRQALKQIDDKKYYEPYLTNEKKIMLLGIGFLDRQLDGRVRELEMV